MEKQAESRGGCSSKKGSEPERPAPEENLNVPEAKLTWLWPGIVPKGRVAVIAGHFWSSCPTELARQMAAKLSTQLSWSRDDGGRYGKAPTAILGDLLGISESITEMGGDPRCIEHFWHIWAGSAHPDKMSYAGGDELVDLDFHAYFGAHTGLVILEPLSDHISPRNPTEDSRLLLRVLAEKARAADAAVVVVADLKTPFLLNLLFNGADAIGFEHADAVWLVDHNESFGRVVLVHAHSDVSSSLGTRRWIDIELVGDCWTWVPEKMKAHLAPRATLRSGE